MTKQTDQELFIYRRLNDEQLQLYEENGYVLYGRILTDAGLDALREDSISAWREENREFDPDKMWLQNMLLPNVHHQAA